MEKVKVNGNEIASTQIEAIMDFAKNKMKTRGLGLLYFILIDLYIDHIAMDKFIHDMMRCAVLRLSLRYLLIKM